MNKTSFRTLVRRDLKDEDSGNYRWTNDEVDRMVDLVIRRYSKARPNDLKATIATTNDSRTVSLSTLSNIVTIYALEFSIDKYPRQYQPFTWYGTNLEMVGDRVGDGNNCYVYYGKVHDIDASTWTIDGQHEHIIALGAAAYALLQYAIFSVNRVNAGGIHALLDALKLGEQKFRAFEKELRKLRGVRKQSLYTPSIPMQGQATDWGPP